MKKFSAVAFIIFCMTLGYITSEAIKSAKSAGQSSSVPCGAAWWCSMLGAGNAGSAAALQTDASGNLKVNVAAGGGSGGTSSTFGAAFPGTGTAVGMSDGVNMQPFRGDQTNGVFANIKTSVLPTGAATSANQATNGATTAHTCSVAGFSELGCLGQIADEINSSIPAGSNLIGNVGASINPAGSTPITASTTGTTAATTATLAANATLHTYICWLSIRANATAAATGNATVTGTVTGTLNFTQWTAPLASGLGVTEMVFNPCIISSAVNTAIAVVSAAPGSGGTVSVSAGGYQL